MKTKTYLFLIAIATFLCGYVYYKTVIGSTKIIDSLLAENIEAISMGDDNSKEERVWYINNIITCYKEDSEIIMEDNFSYIVKYHDIIEIKKADYCDYMSKEEFEHSGKYRCWHSTLKGMCVPPQSTSKNDMNEQVTKVYYKDL